MATTLVIESPYMWSKKSLLALVCIALIGLSEHAQDKSTAIDPVLIQDSEGTWKLVRAHCTSCHSSQILKPLRLSRDAWQGVIKRMQDEEGLWDLGEDESKIIEYLTTYFGPTSASSQRPSRRAPIAPTPLTN